MVYCTNCATEIKDNWNACPNCGKVVNETSSQVNTSNPQNIVQDYSSVDDCLEEIKSISNYRTVNSNNKKKAFQISLLLNTIYQVYNYIKWTIIDPWRQLDEFTFDYFLDSRQVQDFLFYDSEFYYIFLSPLAGTSGWYYECKLFCEEGVSGGAGGRRDVAATPAVRCDMRLETTRAASSTAGRAQDLEPVVVVSTLH